MAKAVRPGQLVAVVFGGELDRLEQRRYSIVHLHRSLDPDTTARVFQP
jgi:hypothetical protein